MSEWACATVRIDTKLRAAWVRWYRSKGLSSRFRIEHLAHKRALRGKWPM